MSDKAWEFWDNNFDNLIFAIVVCVVLVAC